VEEVLLQGATEREIAETLDVALYMGGSLSTKMVRYAFQILEERRAARR
jgi:alkylhydroperoxidase/carboxymuconolactone decarboxylase family protein YurZ